MTAEQWVQSVLASKLIGDNIYLGDNQQVGISTLCTFFRTAIEDDKQPDKYVALSGSHTFMWGDPPVSVTRSAEELGYQAFFDQWHAEGII